MEKFQISGLGKKAAFLVENEAWEGVRKIAGRVAEDLELVTGIKPEVESEWTVFGKKENIDKSVIFAASIGKSPLLERLGREGKLDLSGLAGKREVYLWQIVKDPIPELPAISEILVIAGSDKRGTIYGLFALSEHCGVSPLIYWGDVTPAHRDELALELEEPYLSGEPSVEYRGFFINDEWPAFGNWCMEHFGGVNAKAYEHVFELLLRLKGNYMWPAMWNSTFSEDGPGIENARLADLYGVVMGASHHEPMCRAGAEWQNIYARYGEDSSWSFVTNEEAITKFWEDGIKRNKEFENVITIGMRGENDSKLLSADATLADNIDVVKKAILVQHDLIRKTISEDLSSVPRMLAIYKEVEDYYYGTEDCPGLKDWDELDDVILMLCEDNFGNTRGLPENGGKDHPGGYGMYYHFDYHGSPISYEWQNSARLTKTWEQMTQAYEYGVRKLWIVNVGDIKGSEYPLNYFMDLAYDYEKWGVNAPNRTAEYLDRWISRQFGERLNAEQRQELKEIIDGWTRWSAARRPEAMNPDIYHPVHFREAERVRETVLILMERIEAMKSAMPKECMSAYCSMIYYPAMATLNLIAMHTEAGMNAWLADQGSLRANPYGESVKERIRADRAYVAAYHALEGGKWNHMMDSAHTGFRSWNDYNWTYPAAREVIPTPGGRALVRFRGSSIYCLGEDWGGAVVLKNDEFTRPDTEEIVLDIDSRGEQGFSYEIVCDADWLVFDPQAGHVDPEKEGFASVYVTCAREKVRGAQSADILLRLRYDGGRQDSCKLVITAEGIAAGGAETCAEGRGTLRGAFAEKQGMIVIDAAHYHEKSDVDGAGWRVIQHLGRMGDAVKAFPVTINWMERETKPWLAYDVAADREGVYTLELWCAARNPVQKGAPMRCLVSANEDAPVSCETASSSLYTDGSNREWSLGVLDNIRKSVVKVSLKKGSNRIYLYAGDPGIVPERIILYPEDKKMPQSYLGPKESIILQ